MKSKLCVCACVCVYVCLCVCVCVWVGVCERVREGRKMISQDNNLHTYVTLRLKDYSIKCTRTEKYQLSLSISQTNTHTHTHTHTNREKVSQEFHNVGKMLSNCENISTSTNFYQKQIKLKILMNFFKHFLGLFMNFP